MCSVYIVQTVKPDLALRENFSYEGPLGGLVHELRRV